MKSKLFCLPLNAEESPDKNCWQLEKNENYIKDIDIALIARLISGCIENDIELDTEIVTKFLYGNYKKVKLKDLIDKGSNR